MPRVKLPFGEMCPDEFKSLGDCQSDVGFFHNDDLLDTVPIDPETGDMYPDLPQEIWDSLQQESMGMRFAFTWDGPYCLKKVMFYDKD